MSWTQIVTEVALQFKLKNYRESNSKKVFSRKCIHKNILGYSKALFCDDFANAFG